MLGAEQGPQEQVMKVQGGNRSLRRIDKQNWIDHLKPRQRWVPQLVLSIVSDLVI